MKRVATAMCDAQVLYHHALSQHPGGSHTAVSLSKAGYGFGCVLTVDTCCINTIYQVYQDEKKGVPNHTLPNE